MSCETLPHVGSGDLFAQNFLKRVDVLLQSHEVPLQNHLDGILDLLHSWRTVSEIRDVKQVGHLRNIGILLGRSIFLLRSSLVAGAVKEVGEALRGRDMAGRLGQGCLLAA